jgi:hypothetical protein
MIVKDSPVFKDGRGNYVFISQVGDKFLTKREIAKTGNVVDVENKALPPEDVLCHADFNLRNLARTYGWERID